MTKSHSSGPTVEPHFYLSLEEIITSYRISSETIIEIIEEGIIHVDDDNPETWQFDNESCRRIRLVLQLERDLGVNVAGSGLVLELLKEIDELHTLLALHR